MRFKALLLASTCALLLGTAAGSAGCGSTPTLPLPPPVAIVGFPNAQGLVRVEGDANERAFVHVFNQDLDAGRTERADDLGHFVVDIEAAVGHTLVIWQEDDDGLTGERLEQVVPGAAP